MPFPSTLMKRLNDVIHALDPTVPIYNFLTTSKGRPSCFMKISMCFADVQPKIRILRQTGFQDQSNWDKSLNQLPMSQTFLLLSIKCLIPLQTSSHATLLNHYSFFSPIPLCSTHYYYRSLIGKLCKIYSQTPYFKNKL